MKKRDEVTNPNSCWSRGRADERMFVLLARDEAAPLAIRAWVAERIRLGKNVDGDPQVTEALECADLMEQERQRINYRPHGGGMAGHDDFFDEDEDALPKRHDARAVELAHRLVAEGPKAHTVSCSETHEISEYLLKAYDDKEQADE